MGFALLSRPDDGHPLSVWSQLADIEAVDSDLCPRDRAFLHEVGKSLAAHGCADRFGITLLHSHFHVSCDEALVESVGEDGNLITQVLSLRAAEEDDAIVPRSWRFADDCAAGGREELSVLSWAHRDHLPQEPLSPQDGGLIAGLAQIYRDRGLTGRFGMALRGPAPGTGMIWTEDNDHDSRHLTQAPRPAEEVEGDGQVMTLYSFTPDGEVIVPIGCCTCGSAGHSHARGEYDWGRRC